MAHTSLRWTADPIARAARQIDAYDTIVRSSKRVPGGIRRTEYRDNRCPDSTGQVHRSGVACDEHIETFEDRGQSGQVGVAGNVDDSTVAERGPHGRDKRGVFWTARQHDRCAVRLRQASRDFAESVRFPLLDRASTADVHSDERALTDYWAGAWRPHACADSGIVRVGRERPIARRPKTAATSARALSLVCARGSYSSARSSRPPPPPLAYPAANEAPLRREQQIAADVRLEIDREVVPALAPGQRLTEKLAEALPRGPSCEPVGVEPARRV